MNLLVQMVDRYSQEDQGKRYRQLRPNQAMDFKDEMVSLIWIDISWAHFSAWILRQNSHTFL